MFPLLLDLAIMLSYLGSHIETLFPDIRQLSSFLIKKVCLSCYASYAQVIGINLYFAGILL